MEDGEIEPLVLERHLGLELAAVGESDADIVGAVDHVIVGDHQALLVEDHAGAERTLLLRAVRHLLAEEFVEEGIPGKQRRPLDLLVGIDVDHGVGGLLDEWRKRELDFSLVGRNHLDVFGQARTHRRQHKQHQIPTEPDHLIPSSFQGDIFCTFNGPRAINIRVKQPQPQNCRPGQCPTGS